MINLTLCRISLAAAAMLAVSGAAAQQATERYIPIGMSPGVSSIVGDISAVSYASDSLTVAHGSSSTTIKVSDATRFYLDRYKAGRSSEVGDLRDCKVGVKVEAKMSADGTAEWIKIESG